VVALNISRKCKKAAVVSVAFLSSKSKQKFVGRSVGANQPTMIQNQRSTINRSTLLGI
jgi:hypothetical protein